VPELMMLLCLGLVRVLMVLMRRAATLQLIFSDSLPPIRMVLFVEILRMTNAGLRTVQNVPGTTSAGPHDRHLL
jgi:hypothetical protein